MARTAVVTGASSGIGKALCYELALRGFQLLVSSRREEPLQALAQDLTRGYDVAAAYVAGDITSPETHEKILAEVQNRFGGLDLLVNNAGAGVIEKVEETTEEAARRVMEINYFAPFLLTKSALPLLSASAQSLSFEKDRKRYPAVVFLSSIIGLVGTPYYSAYGAAKAAVRFFADSLRAEVAKKGIHVLTVMPGTTQTEFFDKLLESQSMPNFPKHRAVPPEVVAKKIVRALEKGKHRLVPHIESKLLNTLERISPNLVDWMMSRY